MPGGRRRVLGVVGEDEDRPLPRAAVRPRVARSHCRSRRVPRGSRRSSRRTPGPGPAGWSRRDMKLIECPGPATKPSRPSRSGAAPCRRPSAARGRSCPSVAQAVQAPATWRVAAFSRFQTLIELIAISRAESPARRSAVRPRPTARRTRGRRGRARRVSASVSCERDALGVGEVRRVAPRRHGVQALVAHPFLLQAGRVERTHTLQPLIWLARRFTISMVSVDTPAPQRPRLYAVSAFKAAGTNQS